MSKTIEQIAVETLQCAITWDPDAKLIGNVSAREVATLAQHLITSCPKCGAEPWVNIDCDLCRSMHDVAAEANGEARGERC